MRTINPSRLPQKGSRKLSKLKTNSNLDVAVEVDPCEVVDVVAPTPELPLPEVEVDSALAGLHRDLDTFMRGGVEVADSVPTGPTWNPELIDYEGPSDAELMNTAQQPPEVTDLPTSDETEVPCNDDVTAALQHWVNRLANIPYQDVTVAETSTSKKRDLASEAAEKTPEKKKKRKYTKSSATVAAAGAAKATATGATTSGKVSSAAACPPGGSIKKAHRAQKQSKFRIIPLTEERWPSRFGYSEEPGEITPEQVFYPPGDNSTLIEVYREPHITGVSIRQYLNKPYERRVNLSPKDFRSLHYRSTDLIQNHARITDDARQGLPSSTNYISYLNKVACTTKVLVNLYHGQAKIHVGTPSYIDEMNNPLPPGRQPINSSHCGHTLTLNTIKDINERVGPLLEKSNNFYVGETECDE